MRWVKETASFTSSRSLPISRHPTGLEDGGVRGFDKTRPTAPPGRRSAPATCRAVAGASLDVRFRRGKVTTVAVGVIAATSFCTALRAIRRAIPLDHRFARGCALACFERAALWVCHAPPRTSAGAESVSADRGSSTPDARSPGRRDAEPGRPIAKIERGRVSFCRWSTFLRHELFS